MKWSHAFDSEANCNFTSTTTNQPKRQTIDGKTWYVHNTKSSYAEYEKQGACLRFGSDHTPETLAYLLSPDFQGSVIKKIVIRARYDEPQYTTETDFSPTIAVEQGVPDFNEMSSSFMSGYSYFGGTSNKKALTKNLADYTFESEDGFTIAEDKYFAVRLYCSKGVEFYIRSINITFDDGKTLVLNEEAKNDDEIEKHLLETRTIQLQRSLHEYIWNTFCVPFDMTKEQLFSALSEEDRPYAEAQILELDETKGAGSDEFFFKEVNKITAGVPCLVKPTIPIENPTYNNVQITVTKAASAKTDDSHQFVGIYSYEALDASTSAFMNASGQIVRPEPNIDLDPTHPHYNTYDMKGMRCYFVLPSDQSPAKAVFQGISTGIGEITGDVVCRSGNVYNMQGQCVSKQGLTGIAAGIYIMNGRKYLIK